MNVPRAFLSLPLCALLACPAFGQSPPLGITVSDTCGKLISGGVSSGDPAVSVGSDGAVSVAGFAGAYTAGVGQCDALPADGKPVCTLSASATKLVKNASATLYVRCSASTTQFTWNGPAGGPLPAPNPGTTNAVSLTFPNAGAYTYSVAGTSAGVTGFPSTPVTILVGDASDVPACTLTISPASITEGGTANARVVCNPEAASYTWDAAEAGAPAQPGNVGAATLTFGTAGTYTYKVLGARSTGELGPKASATVTVKVLPGSCTNGPVTLDYSGTPLMPAVETGDITFYQGYVAAWSFTSASSPTIDFSGTTNSYYWPMPTSTWSISRCKGDFNVTGPCIAAGFGNYPGMSATTNPAAPPGSYCVLSPGITYYLNIKATACSSPPCGMKVYRGH